MSPFSPLLREAAFWFALGSAIAFFVVAVVVALVAAAPGIGSPASVARAVAKGVDAMIDSATGVTAPPARQPQEEYLLPPPRGYSF